LGLGQIGPDQRLIGGAARGMLDQGRAKVRVDLGILVEFPFPTPAGLADPGGGPLGEVLEVALPLADGLGINAQELGGILNPPVSQLGRLDGGVPPAIVLAQGRAEGLHGLLDGAGIGCHDRPRGMGPRAEPGPLYHTTARRRRQGRALQLSASAGVPTGTAAGGSRERPLSLDLPQRPGANGALAAGSREIISSAFHAGREHWPHCYSAVLAGAGIRGGAVHGASDRWAAYPARDPVSPDDLGATILHALGIDPATEIRDPVGRPLRINGGEPPTKVFA